VAGSYAQSMRCVPSLTVHVERPRKATNNRGRGYCVKTPTARERIAGCLLGGAIGDALGAPIEFDSLEQIRARFGPAGLTTYAPAYGRIGAITDDTQMTLFTAEGLIRANARSVDRGIVNVAWIVSRAYCRWLVTQDGPDIQDADLGSAVSGWLITNDVLHARRAPGTTCLGALSSGRWGTPQQPLNDSKGCGGVMRVAPVGLIATGGRAFDLGADLAAITHGHPTGYLAAGAFAVIVGEVMAGSDLVDAVAAARTELVGHPGSEETVAALDAAVELAARGEPSPEEIESLGGAWVAEEALAIGVCCALVARDPRHGLLLAVNHGGDADSTGSIAGNLLGTIHGRNGLPADLLDTLEARDIIEQVGRDLADAFVDGKMLPYQRYPAY